MAGLGDRGARRALLAREGEYWSVAFGGRELRVRDSKGVGYLATLLAAPGREFGALELVGGAGAGGVSEGEAFDAGLATGGDGDLGPVLDVDAKRAYRERISELEAEIDEAERFHDPERAAAARAEYESVLGELSAATGLGGRDRRQGSAVERARLNVTRAIRNAIARIAEHDADLAAHLTGSVQTGRVCTYRPALDEPVTWEVATQSVDNGRPQPKEPATVTLLFTDVVGSTELISRLGDARAEALWNEHQALLAELVERQSGELIKTLGDGVMAAFGRASDAVRCAVEMQLAVEERNDSADTEPIEIRVGINAGELHREGGDYFGAAVVVARRLCDSAPGGGVFVSGTVRHLVGSRDEHSFRPLGLIALKGLAEPIETFELGWRGHEPAAGADQITDLPPIPTGLATDGGAGFVGREQQFALLTEQLDRARGGRLELALLAGEAGIGKTRLASEIASRAHSEGAVVLYGRCDEDGGIPFQPWVEALARYADGCPAAVLRRQLSDAGGELARLLPALRERFPELPQPAPGDATAERYWLFESVRKLLAAIASERPLVLVLDDLHWADRPTLLLLLHMSRAEIDVPILIVATYRDVEITAEHPLSETLTALRREEHGTRIPLTGLREADARAMVREWARGPVPPAVVQAIWEQTEGHPFFLREVLRNLLESGVASEVDGVVELTYLPPAAVPDGVREVVADRLRRLGPATRKVLTVASVVGQRFAPELLEQVTDTRADELYELLDGAAAAQVIQESPGGYSFSHALVRQTLYEQLTGPNRARLHVQIARALEAGAPDRHLGELAHHFAQAGDDPEVIEKAAEYATGAAEHATARLAYEEAVGYYQQAIRALARLDGDHRHEQCRLLVELGERQRDYGDVRAANTTFRGASDLAEQFGDHQLFARAALGLAGRIAEAILSEPARVAQAERALSLLGDEITPLRALLMVKLSEMLTFSPRWAEARPLAEQAVALARAAGDDAALAWVLVTSLQARLRPGDAEMELEITTEAKRLAQGSGDMGVLAIGHAFTAFAHLERADLARASGEVEEIEGLAERLRNPYYDGLSAQEMLAFFDRRPSELEDSLWRRLEVGPYAVGVFVGTFFLQMTYVRMIQGRHDEIVAAHTSVAALLWPEVECRGAAVLLYAGRRAEAVAEFERLAAHDFADLPRDYCWLTALEHLAEVAGRLGDAHRARLLYDLLEPYADTFIVANHAFVPLGVAHRQLGLLASTFGDYDLAVTHFEAALDPTRLTGTPYALAKCRYEYARMLRARRAPGDDERSSELIGEARELADGFEMAHLTRLLDELTAPAATNRERRAPIRARARAAADDAKAAVMTRGRAVLGRALADATDAELERRFGPPLAQKALMTAMARAFQPRYACGFEGEIAIELSHHSEAEPMPPPDWWTLRIRGRRATARRGPGDAPALVLHTSIPTFIRLATGQDTPVMASLQDRMQAEGDLILGARMSEMFGSVDPADVIRDTPGAR